MEAGVDVLELGDADLGVDGGGVEVFVAEELLDVADVRPGFVEVAGAGVAQQVGAALAPHVGGADLIADLSAQHVGAERSAVAGEEQGLLAVAEGKQGADFGEVAVEPAQGPFADGNVSVLAAFAEPDMEDAALVVDVVEVQLGQFGAPDGGRVEQLKDCPVADSERVGDVGDGQHRVELADGQGLVG